MRPDGSSPHNLFCSASFAGESCKSCSSAAGYLPFSSLYLSLFLSPSLFLSERFNPILSSDLPTS